MENRYSETDGDTRAEAATPASRSARLGSREVDEDGTIKPVAPRYELLDSEQERTARQRLFDEVLAGVELVLVADGAAFWREEPDHSLVLAASRSIPRKVLDALDRHVTAPLQSIMQRWPESPLVAVPINDPANPIAEEIRQVTDEEGIVGLAGVPCRTPGEMLGLLISHPSEAASVDGARPRTRHGLRGTARHDDDERRALRVRAISGGPIGGDPRAEPAAEPVARR